MPGGQPERRLSGLDRSKGMLRHPLSLFHNPHRERHQSAKSWGCGGKAPARLRRQPMLAFEAGRTLIMHNCAVKSTLLKQLVTFRREVL